MWKWITGIGIAGFMFFMALFAFLLFIPIMIVSTISGTESQDTLKSSQVSAEGTAQVSEAVERYRPLFEKYAEKYGIPEYTELLMAKTMQESGGRHADVMQASESLGLPPNTITDPERSIDVGVKYFSQVLENANGNVKLALQSYNFGGGFIDYVKENHDGKYSKDAAVAFSQKKENQLGWSNYGDVNYVQNVMRYLKGFKSEPKTVEFDGSGGKWQLPIATVNITSQYGQRIHPITGESSMHSGTDFDCDRSDSIHSVKDGEVVKAVQSNIGYGNHVVIKHNDNEFSAYGHLSALSVQSGAKVSAGEKIGMCGTTGSSTGTHLHLEHRTSENGGKQDPSKILGL